MSNPILYGFTKKDLEHTIELVVKRLRKTELVNQTIIDTTEDRLTQKEAAKFLGKSEQCLIQWRKKKLIPFYKIAGSVFYSKKELLDTARNNPGLVKPAYK
tara:strand:- start:3935 stop:4237 length:303 start_codon:yes stop_codon:yes gene_type:complete